jgi:hypothetical protein
MDNLSSHKKLAVRQAIEATGATLLFLPAYSPDLNPIEQVFAKLKALLRKMALRSVEALWKALGSITGCVSPQECKNFIRHAGYFPVKVKALEFANELGQVQIVGASKTLSTYQAIAGLHQNGGAKWRNFDRRHKSAPFCHPEACGDPLHYDLRLELDGVFKS